ncbi:sugar transferase [Lichenifustis flavocetrariae]|uniref:Sugar transferase n=1 Tax=Lichenifustis flavocetrariae TaxID=2949735 RepID=A0AA41Z4D9_9HYPH|nr:sugar transferase [Lichenifustis flavocetrariae]MCW6509042.1 sugar transferase [Lichenifustis flavocetrariae]
MSEATGSIEASAEFSADAPFDCVDGLQSGALSDVKRGFDFGVALTALVLFAPLIATIALVLLVSQGRPVLIRHRRIGRKGKDFPCFKFRTMVRDADKVLQGVLEQNPAMRAEWESRRKLQNDPRITSFGRVLRETSVDEIPQLFNVLLGDMSLVGPRPIVQDEVAFYGPKIAHYHRVRPGLTGAWQVGGRSDVSFSKRVELDTAYVMSWSFKADIRILIKTIPVVLNRKGSC